MREVTRIVYEAFDGETFDSEAKCAAYEKDFAWKRLVGLTEDDIKMALTHGTGPLAEALVTIGYRIAGMNKRKATPRPNPADKEPFLPDPIGGPDGGPPEPPETYPAPMTADEALNHRRP